MTMEVSKVIKESILGTYLTDDESKLIADLTKTRKLAKDELLFSAGDLSEQLYIVVDGRIEIIKNFGERDETIMNTLKPGCITGELSFIESQPHSMTLKSRKEAEVITLHRDDFEKLLDSNPKVIYQVMRAILAHAHRLQRDLNSRFMEMNRFVTNQYM